MSASCRPWASPIRLDRCVLPLHSCCALHRRGTLLAHADMRWPPAVRRRRMTRPGRPDRSPRCCSRPWRSWAGRRLCLGSTCRCAIPCLLQSALLRSHHPQRSRQARQNQRSSSSMASCAMPAASRRMAWTPSAPSSCGMSTTSSCAGRALSMSTFLGLQERGPKRALAVAQQDLPQPWLRRHQELDPWTRTLPAQAAGRWWMRLRSLGSQWRNSPPAQRYDAPVPRCWIGPPSVPKHQCIRHPWQTMPIRCHWRTSSIPSCPCRTSISQSVWSCRLLPSYMHRILPRVSPPSWVMLNITGTR
mmetsp:Transcript_26826/g.67478  ORF Transcript_26826/g.67478 Transcript_26826/m.67478 type:complete len:303 (-) Transcript_26826:1085-1993(-)